MSYILEALSGSVQASALDLSQNGIATLEFQDQHRRLYHVSTLMVGRLGDLWEWIVLNHQQAPDGDSAGKCDNGPGNDMAFFGPERQDQE